ncbi:hypothetical protein [Halomonas garicola]|uniref:hypothetical protein n=1 Tax=Halomonas garicola TaxID=1690008 RepID=UPI0028985D52|nr:hypothetical protein [Halomonas garicola]
MKSGFQNTRATLSRTAAAAGRAARVACHIERPLPEAAKVALVDRNIAYYNARGHLVLADAGKAFFNDIFRETPVGGSG